jgi:glucose/arabinose dehydrogenase
LRSILSLLTLLSCLSAFSAEPTEDDFYPIRSFAIPKGEVIEPGGFELLPDGRLAVCSRRGEIWMIENAFGDNIESAKFTRFAEGLHEPLGLAYRDGWLYAIQRGELSRLRDSDEDGRADEFETICDDWSISGDYHEYAFVSKFDHEGNLWIPFCLTGSFSSDVPYRGWCVRVTPTGEMIPTCSGLRSPGGIAFNAEGDAFYTDNQGPWNGTCSLKFLKPGSFQGHPAGNRWYELPAVQKAMGEKPEEPKSGSRFHVEADRIPQYMPPVVLFPYSKMGQSASGIACDMSGGKFGPFAHQLFVGDQTHSTVMRVFLEKVDGHYQGACFPFRAGFGSGTVPVELTTNGQMIVGGTNRGWGSRGPKEFAIERVDWTGRVPCEVFEMHALPDGFELVFTKPVDAGLAADVASYTISTYTYIFQSTYGSPEVDHTSPTITSAEPSSDGLRVRLKIDGLQRGHVHELHLDGVKARDGEPLLHPVAYYTLMWLPKGESAAAH